MPEGFTMPICRLFLLPVNGRALRVIVGVLRTCIESLSGHCSAVKFFTVSEIGRLVYRMILLYIENYIIIHFGERMTKSPL